jgi:tRNA nucleotidyltransferase (CCA-adding enzyme)
MTTGSPAAGEWSHFRHGADVGVRGKGPTKAAAFEQAARALFAAVTPLDRIAPRAVVEIACEAPNDGLLLVDWLNALIYRMAVDRMLFSRFEVALGGARLSGRAWGEPVDPARHEPAVEPKGATYTALSVRREAGGDWVAECVVDV